MKRCLLPALVLLASSLVAACAPRGGALPSATATVAPGQPATPPPTPTRRPAPPTATPEPAATPTPAPAARLASLVAQANRAYRGGRVDGAIALYRQALAAAERSTPDRQRLVAFARFRLGLAALVTRDERSARHVLQEDFRTDPDEAFRQMAFRLWDTYAMSADLSAACMAASNLAKAENVQVVISQEEVLGPTDICVLPPSR